MLELKEIDKPIPKDNQVLVKVAAASVNPLDWHILRGKPFLIRLMGFGILKPKKTILGADIAGVIEAVGKDVKEFKVGDEVFGGVDLGGFAEYRCASERRFVLKPANMTFEEAASVPVAALTALQGLRKGNIQAGHKVLINGASGGVGTFAVQIAKSFGAEVTGVCSTRNVELVHSLGADHVIDYTKEDFTNTEQRYDIIIDNAASRSLFRIKRILNRGGTYVLIGGSSMSLLFQAMLLGPLISVSSGKKIQSMMASTNKRDLAFMKELIESGKVKAVIDRRYPFIEIPDAVRYIEEGHARGKVVIKVNEA